MVVFGNGRRKGYPWDFLLVLWPHYDGFYLHDGYLWSVDGLCSIDVVYGDWAVSDLICLNGFF